MYIYFIHLYYSKGVAYINTSHLDLISIFIIKLIIFQPSNKL